VYLSLISSSACRVEGLPDPTRRDGTADLRHRHKLQHINDKIRFAQPPFAVVTCCFATPNAPTIRLLLIAAPTASLTRTSAEVQLATAGFPLLAVPAGQYRSPRPAPSTTIYPDDHTALEDAFAEDFIDKMARLPFQQTSSPFKDGLGYPIRFRIQSGLSTKHSTITASLADTAAATSNARWLPRIIVEPKGVSFCEVFFVVDPVDNTPRRIVASLQHLFNSPKSVAQHERRVHVYQMLSILDHDLQPEQQLPRRGDHQRRSG
jgi:hypothetical protein